MNRYVAHAIATAFVFVMFVMGVTDLHAQTANVEKIEVDVGNTSPTNIVIQQTTVGGTTPVIKKNGSNVGLPRNITVGSAPPKLAKNAGYTTCGGITANGKVQAPCSSTAAKFKGRLSKACPRGSTLNKSTSACWKNCPKGYKHQTDGGKVKCRRTEKVAYSPAKLTKPKAVNPCSRGATLFNGKCNLCPKGFKIVASKGRSAKNRCERKLPVWINTKGGKCPADYKVKRKDGKKQCRRTAKISYSPAKLTKPAPVQPCTRGATLFNGKCNTCPKGFKIVAKKGRSDKNRCERQLPVWLNTAQTKSAKCKPGQFWDKAQGGSCWTCPAQFTRDKFYSGSYKKRLPTDKKACTSIGIGWQTPIYADPGLFGLKGTDIVAIDILKNNPAGIDEMINRMAKYSREVEGQSVPKSFARDQWRLIRDTPQDSPALNGAVYLRMLYMALEPKASPEDKALIKSFEDYVRDRRTFMAQDVLNMYDAWKYAIDTKRDMGLTGTHLSQTMNYGTVPPDFKKVLEKGLTEQGASPVAVAGMLAGGVFASPGPVLGATIGTSKVLVKAKISKDLAVKMAGYGDDVVKAAKVAGKAAKTAKTMLKVGKAFLRGGGGPLIVTSVAAVMIETSINQFIKIETARPNLVKAVKKAKQAVSVKRKLQTKDTQLLMLYWGMANNAPIKPGSAVVQAAKAAHGTKGLN